MKIWAYVTVWNEQEMISYYLRHYSQFCEKIIVLDNESTDGTCMIASTYPMVEIRKFSTSETFNDYVHLELKHKCIQESKGLADYIIVSDCDEFIVHPNIKEFLINNSQYSIFYPAGFQMVSSSFPTGDKQIYDEVPYGVPDPWYSKPILINPNKVNNFIWIDGCHETTLDTDYIGEIMHPVPVEIRPDGEWNGHPWGRWRMQYNVLEGFNSFPIKLLHFKFMSADYVTSRYQLYSQRNSKQNKENGLATHYEDSIANNTIQNQINKLIEDSITVNINNFDYTK
jgi:glycosyltransferase involved in cell wall biosynthesis